MKLTFVLSALMPLLVVSWARSQDTAGLRQVGTIELPNVQGRIDHMAFDAKTGRLFVAALGNNTVEVVDRKAGKVVHSIRGLANPQGIGLASASGKLFVANAKDGSCRAFDAGTYKPLAAVDLKEDADNVRYDQRDRRVYVGFGDGALAVLEEESARKLAEIPLKAHPESFQLEQHGRRIFVNLPEAGGVIAVVDRDKRAVVATWPVEAAKANFPMTLDEEHHRLFVGCRQPAKLVVIDTDTGKLIASLDCVGDTDDVWYDAARKRIYVSGGEGAVTVIGQTDADHYQSDGRVTTANGARTSFFVPERSMLYVAAPRRGNQQARLILLKSE